MTNAAPRDLDTLIEAARHKALAERSDEAAQASVIRVLSDAGGALPVEELIRRGVHRDTLSSLVDEDATSDKRRKVRVRLTIVRLHDGTEVPTAHLTSSGWQAAGRPSGREVFPSAEGIEHSMAPQRLAGWMKQRADAMAGVGITTNVLWGAPCRRFSEDVTARAWGRLRFSPDQSGAIGSLTGGLIPDAIVTERHSSDANFRQAWPGREPSVDDLAELVVAVEVQHSRLANDIYRSKVDRWAAAIEKVDAAAAVVWLVKGRSVADALVANGVTDPMRRPGQLLVPAHLLGFDGDPTVPLTGPIWWPLRLSPGAQKSHSSEPVAQE